MSTTANRYSEMLAKFESERSVKQDPILVDPDVLSRDDDGLTIPDFRLSLSKSI